MEISEGSTEAHSTAISRELPAFDADKIVIMLVIFVIVFNGEFTTGEIYRFLSYSAVSTRGCLLGVELADRFLSTVLRQAACTPVIKVVSESIWGRRNVKGKIDRRRHNRSLG